jgi:hypothetical protein
VGCPAAVLLLLLLGPAAPGPELTRDQQRHTGCVLDSLQIAAIVLKWGCCTAYFCRSAFAATWAAASMLEISLHTKDTTQQTTGQQHDTCIACCYFVVCALQMSKLRLNTVCVRI